ncbi:galaxin [Plectropomus leopardus]|uniref:galaxin n=1 Tax=Plectropomus leopardus TaxID=160734 RepID=UPI001C4B421C|nr:galaxin [Plectropomus leopardus]
MILKKKSSDHLCCGHDQFHKKTECCCPTKGGLQVQPLQSSCCKKCGAERYNEFTQLCCQSTVVEKPAHAKCCGEKAINKHTHLCCGPGKLILKRDSRDHECCGHRQYNQRTQCCYPTKDGLKISPIHSCCSGVQQQKPTPQPICREPNSKLCGSTCYNPNDSRCCERNQGNSQWCCAPGQCDGTPSVYNPDTHICCDGCVSEWNPWKDQCYGGTANGPDLRGHLCCNNTLHTDGEDREECSEVGTSYSPAKETMCWSKFHDQPGQYCCGKETYHSDAEICCNGHSHQKTENTHCCGVAAYNIKDPLKKCCAGTLYNLTIGHEAQCCGTILKTSNQSVCCSSEDKVVLYSTKTGFGCCGHLYYNSSLWSCCAGKLSPVRRPSKTIIETRLLSVNNLKEEDLCNTIHIGTVERVSLSSIMFKAALKIHGRNATVTPLASPYILRHDRCSSPKLTPGKSYFFNEVNVFADVNHDSTHQSLHFIFSKCYRH